MNNIGLLHLIGISITCVLMWRRVWRPLAKDLYALRLRLHIVFLEKRRLKLLDWFNDKERDVANHKDFETKALKMINIQVWLKALYPKWQEVRKDEVD